MFALSRQEKAVLIFLFALMLIGVGANFLRKRYAILPILPSTDSALSKINLNNATEKELISLPGIGPVLAQRILEYRSREGDFSDISELKKIKGITNQTIEKLKDLVVVE